MLERESELSGVELGLRGGEAARRLAQVVVQVAARDVLEHEVALVRVLELPEVLREGDGRRRRENARAGSKRARRGGC